MQVGDEVSWAVEDTAGNQIRVQATIEQVEGRDIKVSVWVDETELIAEAVPGADET